MGIIYGSTGAGSIASTRPSVSSMAMPRRLREQAAVNVVAAAGAAAGLTLNWASPMQDWTDATTFIEVEVAKMVDVKMVKRGKAGGLLLNNKERSWPPKKSLG